VCADPRAADAGRDCKDNLLHYLDQNLILLKGEFHRLPAENGLISPFTSFYILAFSMVGEGRRVERVGSWILPGL
jgi:hypothetical protein